MKQFSKDLGNVSLAPKGKWSKEQEYERLALVYNACDNLSYVAKIDVPIGVEIDNREYWQPMNATGYSDNNFINLTTENENGTITAYENIEEAIATIVPVNRRAGATLSFYNLNADRLDRQAEFELWQFNSTDLANWENKDYWNNVYYNWNVFVGWYIGDDTLKNHVKIPNVGQYAYVGTNLNDAILYQCRTNGIWTNTGIKVRNYISVVVSGNITIGENGNWFSNGEDTGIPATPAVDEQLDNIITKHESLSRTVQGIAATGGASTATNVTYNNDNSGLNAENAQDAIDELQSSKIDKTSILQESGEAEDKIMSQGAVKTELGKKANTTDVDTKFTEEKNRVDGELGKKFDKGNIVQTTGESEYKVISQKATTTAIADETTRAKAAEKTNEETITNEVARLDKKIDTQKNEINAAKEDALQAIAENEQSVITNFNAQRVTPEMLSESTKQLIETSGGGTITNLADDEDLTSVDDGTGSTVLKFADKAYNPDNFSGKGYKILRKNIKKVIDIPQGVVLFDNVVNVDYSNKLIDYDSLPDNRKFIKGLVLNLFDNKFYAIIYMGGSTYNVALTWTSNKYNYNNYYNNNNIKEGIYKSLLGDIYEYKDEKFVEFTQFSKFDNVLEQDMIPEYTSILEIKYCFNLLGKVINLPDNTTLFFNGGKLINGTIFGKNINIINKSGIIFDNIVTLGNYNYDIHYYEFINMSDDDLFTSMTHFNNCYFQSKIYNIYREYGDYDFWVKLSPNTINYNYRNPNVCNIYGNNTCFIIHNDNRRYYTGLIKFVYKEGTNSIVNINNIRIFSNNLIDINIDSSGTSGYFALSQNIQNSNIVGFICDNIIAKVNFNLFNTINKPNDANANGNILIIRNSDITSKNYFISEYYGAYKDYDYEIPITAKSKMILENSKFYAKRDYSFSGINNDANIIVKNCSGNFGFEIDRGFKSIIEMYNCNTSRFTISGNNPDSLKIVDSIIGLSTNFPDSYAILVGKKTYIENSSIITNYETLNEDNMDNTNQIIFKSFDFLKMYNCIIFRDTPTSKSNGIVFSLEPNKGAKLDIYNCTFNSFLRIKYSDRTQVNTEDLDTKLFYTNTFSRGIINGNIYTENDTLNPLTQDFILKKVFLDILLNNTKPIIDKPIKLYGVQDFIYCKGNLNNDTKGFYSCNLINKTVNENDIIDIIINNNMYVKSIISDNTYSGLDLINFIKNTLETDDDFTTLFSVSINNSTTLLITNTVIPFHGKTEISINGSPVIGNINQVKCPIFTRSDGKGFYKNVGTTEERNNIQFIYTGYEKGDNPVYYDRGFRFYNTDTKEYNIYVGDGKWINEKGHPADIKYKGTFLEKPTGADTPIGFEYFCTDRQTVEGTTNGIVLYYKGKGVWVDALGRVVS